MNGTCLSFYVHEKTKHNHRLLHEWLLEQAKALGVHGGSAFRAIAGFGRHGVLSEERFFELAGDLTVKVEFILTDVLADQLLESVRRDSLNVMYARTPAVFGVTGESSQAPGRD
jgi:PII-like signaling protein